MDTGAIINVVLSHALSSGLFESVNGHEPKGAPGNGLTCSIWFNNLRAVQSSGVDSSSARVEFIVRLQTSMLKEPQDNIDPVMISAMDTLIAAYIADFSLGGTVRTIDIRGMDGEGINAQAGYITQDNKTFRIIDLTLPTIVNDVWTETA